jgi:hypothetical protein
MHSHGICGIVDIASEWLDGIAYEINTLSCLVGA